MKTLTIDLKSVFLGAALMGGLLLMANKPAPQSVLQPQPDQPVRRYQVTVSERSRTIIMDTQTGRFLVERPSMGLPGWAPQNFDDLYRGR